MPTINQVFELSCYDVLPISYKITVFESKLLVKKALVVLLNSNLQAAPLWNSKTQTFDGMLTVTDFIKLILHYYNNDGDDIDTLQIEKLKQIVNNNYHNITNNQYYYIHPMDTLKSASLMLLKYNAHRIPLIETSPCGTSQQIVSILTQYQILRFIAVNCNQAIAFNFTPREKGIGTFKNCCTVGPDATLLELLNTFVDKKISSLPIIDPETDTVLDVVEKNDIVNLSKEGEYYDLGMTVTDALKRRPSIENNQPHAGISFKCSDNDTLGAIMHTIKKNIVRRFLVVGSHGKLVGIVALRDILSFLLHQNNIK